MTALWQGARSVLFVAAMLVSIAFDVVTIDLVLVAMVLLEVIDAINIHRILRRYVLLDS